MITPSIFSTVSRGDWPVYEMAASESGSYFMAYILILVLQWSCYYNTDFVQKMAILEEKQGKVHKHIHSVNP